MEHGIDLVPDVAPLQTFKDTEGLPEDAMAPSSADGPPPPSARPFSNSVSEPIRGQGGAGPPSAATPPCSSPGPEAPRPASTGAKGPSSKRETGKDPVALVEGGGKALSLWVRLASP